MQKLIRATVIVVFVGVVVTLFPVSAPAQQWHSVTGGAEVVDAGNRVVGSVCADGGGTVAMLCYQKGDVFFRLSLGETSSLPLADTYFNSTNCAAPALMVSGNQIYPAANVIGTSVFIENPKALLQSATVNSKLDLTGTCVLLPQPTVMSNLRPAMEWVDFNTFTAPFRVREVTSDAVPPTPPSNLTALASAGRIDLAWAAAIDDVAVIGYEVERCTGAGCTNFVRIGTPETTAYGDTGLPSGATFRYRVRAMDAAGNLGAYSSVASGVIPDTTAPSAPSNLTAAAAGPTQVDLSWTASTDNVAVTGYLVERCAGAGCSNFAQIATSAGTTFSDTSVAGSMSYAYRVRAVDAAANSSAYSNVSSALTPAPPDLTPPSAPGNLSASVMGVAQVDLSWIASFDNVAVTGYLLERCSGTGCTNFSLVASPAGVSYSHTGLSAATSYSYRVKAVDGALNPSGYSNTVTATTAAFLPGSFIWSRAFHGSAHDLVHGFVTDSAGNIFVTGTSTGTLDLGIGALPAFGGEDIFVAKFSSAGDTVWSRRIGNNLDQEGRKITLDAAGDIFIMGHADGVVDFGNGAVLNGNGTDTYLAKLSGVDGATLWVHGFGTSHGSHSFGMDVDSAGNLMVAGEFEGTMNFGGGISLVSVGLSDCFLGKYSAAGVPLWAKRYGDFQSCIVDDLATDSAGNSVITGEFTGTVNFGGSSLISAGALDVYAAKVDTNGNHVWSKRFGDGNNQTSSGVAVDAANNIILAGKFAGTINFGGANLTSSGPFDAFVVKFNPNGIHAWSKRFGSSDSDLATGVAIDNSANVIITGTFRGTVNFGGAALTATGTEAFVVRMDAAGNHVWSRQIQGRDMARPLVTTIGQDVALVGDFDQSIDFGQGPIGTIGGTDLFLSRLRP